MKQTHLPTFKINCGLLGVCGGVATIWQLLPGRMGRLELQRFRFSLLTGEPYIVRGQQLLPISDEPHNR
ncbi:MAG: hypothetical protein ACP5R6_02755 [Chlorobaculum sp.]